MKHNTSYTPKNCRNLSFSIIFFHLFHFILLLSFYLTLYFGFYTSIFLSLPLCFTSFNPPSSYFSFFFLLFHFRRFFLFFFFSFLSSTLRHSFLSISCFLFFIFLFFSTVQHLLIPRVDFESKAGFKMEASSSAVGAVLGGRVDRKRPRLHRYSSFHH